MKKLFSNHTYTWQQIGVFKLAMFSIGALAGSVWHEFFADNMTLVIVVAVITSAYIVYVSLKQ